MQPTQTALPSKAFGHTDSKLECEIHRGWALGHYRLLERHMGWAWCQGAPGLHAYSYMLSTLVLHCRGLLHCTEEALAIPSA